MLKLIRFLLGLCNHEWVETQKGWLLDADSKDKKGYCVMSRCSRCGKNKREDFL